MCGCVRRLSTGDRWNANYILRNTCRNDFTIHHSASTFGIDTQAVFSHQPAKVVSSPGRMRKRMDRRDVLKLGGLASLTPFSSLSDSSSMRGSSHQRAADRRAELYGLLGALPDRKRPIHAKKRGEEERDGYLLETWDLDLNGIEPVPAYL